MFRYSIPLALVTTPAFADPGDRWHMMNWGYGMGMMFGPILWLIVIGLIVAGIVWMVRRSDNGATAQQDSSSQSKALDVLDMRLANGEIDADEYATRRKLLSGE